MPVGVEMAAALAGVSAQAGVDLIKAVAGALTGGRSVIVEIDNNTPLTLTQIAHHHDHGGFPALPPLTIPPATVVVFGSQSKAGSIGTGTEGSISYAGNGVEMLVGWSNPFVGDNATNVGSNNSGLGGPNATKYLVIHHAGVGNQAPQAHMRFMLFVHPRYSLREALREKGVSLKKDATDFANSGISVLFPGVRNIRTILPNSTSIDLT